MGRLGVYFLLGLPSSSSHSAKLNAILGTKKAFRAFYYSEPEQVSGHCGLVDREIFFISFELLFGKFMPTVSPEHLDSLPCLSGISSLTVHQTKRYKFNLIWLFHLLLSKGHISPCL